MPGGFFICLQAWLRRESVSDSFFVGYLNASPARSQPVQWRNHHSRVKLRSFRKFVADRCNANGAPLCLKNVRLVRCRERRALGHSKSRFFPPNDRGLSTNTRRLARSATRRSHTRHDLTRAIDACLARIAKSSVPPPNDLVRRLSSTMPLAANVAQILEGRSRDPTADAETPTCGRLFPCASHRR
jgi:hypothetical protein